MRSTRIAFREEVALGSTTVVPLVYVVNHVTQISNLEPTKRKSPA